MASGEPAPVILDNDHAQPYPPVDIVKIRRAIGEAIEETINDYLARRQENQVKKLLFQTVYAVFQVISAILAVYFMTTVWESAMIRGVVAAGWVAASIVSRWYFGFYPKTVTRVGRRLELPYLIFLQSVDVILISGFFLSAPYFYGSNWLDQICPALTILFNESLFASWVVIFAGWMSTFLLETTNCSFPMVPLLPTPSCAALISGLFIGMNNAHVLKKALRYLSDQYPFLEGYIPEFLLESQPPEVVLEPEIVLESHIPEVSLPKTPENWIYFAYGLAGLFGFALLGVAVYFTRRYFIIAGRFITDLWNRIFRRKTKNAQPATDDANGNVDQQPIDQQNEATGSSEDAGEDGSTDKQSKQKIAEKHEGIISPESSRTNFVGGVNGEAVVQQPVDQQNEATDPPENSNAGSIDKQSKQKIAKKHGDVSPGSSALKFVGGVDGKAVREDDGDAYAGKSSTVRGETKLQEENTNAVPSSVVRPDSIASGQTSASSVQTWSSSLQTNGYSTSSN